MYGETFFCDPNIFLSVHFFTCKSNLILRQLGSSLFGLLSVSLVKYVTAVSVDKPTCTDVLSVSLPTTVTVPARLHAGRNISMSVQPSRRSSRRPTRMCGKQNCLSIPEDGAGHKLNESFIGLILCF